MCVSKGKVLFVKSSHAWSATSCAALIQTIPNNNTNGDHCEINTLSKSNCHVCYVQLLR